MDYKYFLDDDWETVKSFITPTTNLQGLLGSAFELARTNIINGLLSLPNPPNVQHNNYFVIRVAARMGHIDVVKYFIEDNIDIMKECVHSGDINLVEFCLARDMTVCLDCIRICSEAGNIDITKRLLALHPQYCEEAFTSALMREESELMTVLLSDQYISPHYALKSSSLPQPTLELATDLASILDEKSQLNRIEAVKLSGIIKL